MTESEHFARAKSRLHNGTTNEVSRAQAEATLALAYEQRTANLIALYSAADWSNRLTVDQWDDLAQKIEQRLGL